MGVFACIVQNPFKRKTAAKGNGPRTRVELVGDQLDALGAQALQSPRGQYVHGFRGVPLPDLAGAHPIANFGLGHGPVCPMEPSGCYQAACSSIEDEVRKIEAEPKVVLSFAATRLSGAKRLRLGDPRQKPEVLAKLRDRLDESLM